ncbi:hypothetical protein D3C74_207710 [compost metagenome]
MQHVDRDQHEVARANAVDLILDEITPFPGHEIINFPRIVKMLPLHREPSRLLRRLNEQHPANRRQLPLHRQIANPLV